MGVDKSNNKWLATDDGVYFVSPDGTEVYNHFTTANSDIPSNTVWSVECDREHNRVYIFTDNGFDWPRPKTKSLNKIFSIGTENCCEPPSWCRHYLNIRDIKKWMKVQNFLEG